MPSFVLFPIYTTPAASERVGLPPNVGRLPRLTSSCVGPLVLVLSGRCGPIYILNVEDVKRELTMVGSLIGRPFSRGGSRTKFQHQLWSDDPLPKDLTLCSPSDTGTTQLHEPTSTVGWDQKLSQLVSTSTHVQVFESQSRRNNNKR